MRGAKAWVLAAAATVAVAGCASPGGAAQAGLSPAQLAAGADHACVVGGRPPVAWGRLANPVLAYPDAGVKDQALVWAGGRWHMLFSYVTRDVPTPGGEHWSIAGATSADLSRWSAPSAWPDQPGTVGVASPDVVRSPRGGFVATYASVPGEAGGAQSKLYYRTSPDLVHWSGPHRLMGDLHRAPADRLIDPALAWTGNGLILGYKYGPPTSQARFEVAWSQSGSLDGPWRLVGQPAVTVEGGTIENYEFVWLAGGWHLVATSNNLDQPWVFRLQGDPRRPASWLSWAGGRQLAIPYQAWDRAPGLSGVTYEHANSVFVCDARSADGYYYATYAGSDELVHFGGWGHAKIGLARSSDLVHWQVPPERAATGGG
ncbi:MAG TPA: hypothetical protein VKY15_03675 [Acidimicrobiales bacterium]|nr:hypothetical protein [Acidimicrobiales bacterium]